MINRNVLGVTVGGATKTPMFIECYDSIDPYENAFTITIPRKDGSINYQDEVIITRDDTTIFNGLVLNIKPRFRGGSECDFSGLSKLGKLSLQHTADELIEDTDPANIIKLLNQPNRRLSNREAGVSWDVTTIGGIGGDEENAIDRNEESYCDMSTQTDGDKISFDMGTAHYGVCRLRVENEVDYYPRNYKVTVNGLSFLNDDDVDFNAGSLNNVAVNSTGTLAYLRLGGVGSGGTLLIDEYLEYSQANGAVASEGYGWGQILELPAMNLIRLDLLMKQSGTSVPDLNIRGIVHNAYGSFVVGAYGSCTPVAKSSNVIAGSTLPSGTVDLDQATWQTFLFGTVEISAGTYYIGFRQEDYVSGAVALLTDSTGSHEGISFSGESPVDDSCMTAGTAAFNNSDSCFKIFSNQQYALAGTWLSEKTDTYWLAPSYGSISWGGTEPSGTELKFQFKASDTEDGLDSTDYEGASGTADYFTAVTALPTKWDGMRYFQIKAVLETDSSAVTPELDDVTVTIDDEDVYSKTNNICRNIDVTFTPRKTQTINVEITEDNVNDWRVREGYIYSNKWGTTSYFSDYFEVMPADVYRWNGERIELEKREAEIYHDFTKTDSKSLTGWRTKKVEWMGGSPDPSEVFVDVDNNYLKLSANKLTNGSLHVGGLQLEHDYLKPFSSFFVKVKCTPHTGSGAGQGMFAGIGFDNIDYMNYMESLRDGKTYPLGWVRNCVRLVFYDTDNWDVMVDKENQTAGSIDLITADTSSYHNVAVRWNSGTVHIVKDAVSFPSYKTGSIIPSVGLRPLINIHSYGVTNEGTTTLYIEKMCFSTKDSCRVKGFPTDSVVECYESGGSLIASGTVASGLDYVDLTPIGSYAFPCGSTFFKVSDVYPETKEMATILPLNTITEQDKEYSIETTGENRLEAMFNISKGNGVDLWSDIGGSLNFTSKGVDRSGSITFGGGTHIIEIDSTEPFNPIANDIFVESSPTKVDDVFYIRKINSDSISSYGRYGRKFTVKNINSLQATGSYADKVLTMFQNPLEKYNLTIDDTYDSNAFQSSDQVLIEHTPTAVSGTYYITKINRRTPNKVALTIANQKTWLFPSFLYTV